MELCQFTPAENLAFCTYFLTLLPTHPLLLLYSATALSPVKTLLHHLFMQSRDSQRVASRPRMAHNAEVQPVKTIGSSVPYLYQKTSHSRHYRLGTVVPQGCAPASIPFYLDAAHSLLVSYQCGQQVEQRFNPPHMQTVLFVQGPKFIFTASDS